MAKNWAIAVGINHYELLQPLKYAKRDALLMQEFLQTEAGFEQIFFFSDDSPDIGGKSTRPTRTNLLRVLRQLFEQPFMTAGDNFWFFFSGHGVRHNGRDYLMPSDGDPEDIENTAIAINFVTERLRRCGADNVVLLLDACRSLGARAGEGIGRQTSEEARQQGVISIFSCSPQEYSYEIDQLQQGAFTHVLLSGLGIQGKCATVERLNQYLGSRVPEVVRQYKNGKQTPYIIAEPVNKSHLILVPKFASLADIATLKIDAFNAEVARNLDLAEQLWIRVLAAASGQDMDAIKAIQRIERLKIEQQIELTNDLAQPENQQYLLEYVSDNNQITLQEQRDNLQQDWKIQNDKVKKLREAIASTTDATLKFNFQLELKGQELILKKLNKQLNQIESQLQSQSKSVVKNQSYQSSTSYLKTFSFEVVTINAKGEIINRRQHEAKYFVEDLGNGVTLEMVQIPEGSFLMGSPENEKRRNESESPQHRVTVPSFFLGKYVVTQAQYQAIMGDNPSSFTTNGANRPVEKVSWLDAVEFCKRLSQKTGRTYRLPSEAEWEYACRAGTTTPFHFGETITTDLANFIGIYTYTAAPKGKFIQETTLVGSFPPNAFGLYDMHGNVWEWCQDSWHGNYQNAPTVGSAWLNISENDNQIRLVLRGGSWKDFPDNCRSACRGNGNLGSSNDAVGFRVACAAAWT
jgi:formylglycine-generating enzyme required for sulfatase activity/uncharacterized caspase-like protein